MTDSTIPAIGISITANVDGNRQIVFQHFYAADLPDAEINAGIDRMMNFSDRQRARYELPELREERRKIMDENAQYAEDLATAEANHERAQAGLDVQIETLQSDHKEAFETAYAEHRRSGRTGSFVPKGVIATNLERLKMGIAQADETKKKNDEERRQFLQNMQIAMDRRTARLAVLADKIAELEKVLG